MLLARQVLLAPANSLKDLLSHLKGEVRVACFQKLTSFEGQIKVVKSQFETIEDTLS